MLEQLLDKVSVEDLVLGLVDDVVSGAVGVGDNDVAVDAVAEESGVEEGSSCKNLYCSSLYVHQYHKLENTPRHQMRSTLLRPRCLLQLPTVPPHRILLLEDSV